MDNSESCKKASRTLAVGFLNAIAFGLNVALITVSFAIDSFGGHVAINPLVVIFAVINGIATYYSWQAVRDALNQKA